MQLVPLQRGTHLLRADGTIPIFYQGVKYNIPLKMFLPEVRGGEGRGVQLDTQLDHTTCLQ
jgi:hypothetical protein